MNLPKLLPIALAAVAGFTALPRASAQVSPVSMQVQVQSATEPDKHTTVQKRSLKVSLSNNSTQDISGLKLKYYYFVRSAKDHDPVLKNDGEKLVDVKSHKTEIVETPVLSSSFTEAHAENKGKGGNNNNNNNRNNTVNLKKVEASGERIVGHGAQLFSSDGKLLQEFFSEPSLKTKVGNGAQ